MRAVAGAAFIIMPPCASPPMASSSPSGVFSPLGSAPTDGTAKYLRYPHPSGQKAPVRPERHDPPSIHSVRRHLILVQRLPRCPAVCASSNRLNNPIYDTVVLVPLHSDFDQ